MTILHLSESLSRYGCECQLELKAEGLRYFGLTYSCGSHGQYHLALTEASISQ